MTTTMTVTDCKTCKARQRAVFTNERTVASLARRLAYGDNLRPNQQRGFTTALGKAKMSLASSKQMLEDHQYGECEG